MKKYTTIWTQLSDAFNGYGDYLMFESQNEELGWSSVWNQWGGTSGKEESYGYVNEINQAFVDTVRASGGNNEKRHLLISGYNTDITLTCDPLFQMPDDPAGRCALSVHYYTPAGFALLIKDESWGKATSTWGTDADYKELNYYMDMLDARYASQGVPVIIGEYGCPKENKEAESVRRFITGICEAALSRGGICPVLWDTTGLHYDRNKCKMTDSLLNTQLLEVRDKYIAKAVSGDVNSDGEFSVSDLVMTQEFLLGNGTLINWKAGDLCSDNKINSFDIIMMRRLITSA